MGKYLIITIILLISYSNNCQDRQDFMGKWERTIYKGNNTSDSLGFYYSLSIKEDNTFKKIYETKVPPTLQEMFQYGLRKRWIRTITGIWEITNDKRLKLIVIDTLSDSSTLYSANYFKLKDEKLIYDSYEFEGSIQTAKELNIYEEFIKKEE